MKYNNVQFDSEGDIIDYLTGKKIKDTPEERVRQSFIKTLEIDYGYPKELMRSEVAIQKGSKILVDKITNDEIRADIVIYKNEKSALNNDQGNIVFVVECKRNNRKDGYNQLVSYIYNTSAVGGVWTNGIGISVFKKENGENTGLSEIASLPKYKQSWTDEDDCIPNKDQLPRPRNVRFLLSSCHNKLYGRGMENEDFDLAMDMVRILLAKIQDETSPGKNPVFWITNKEFESAEGRNKVAEKVQKLFRKYADQYPDIFDEHEKIQVGNDCIAEAVGVLQRWSLAACDDDAEDWDLMGETYEQFTHVNLKRQRGQFFTNRLVVNMMVRMLDPEIGENILDPAGGSGGFATAVFRYLRRKVIDSTLPNSSARERQFSTIKNSVFLVEIAVRLVKIAKCAMLLTGDGQSGMTRGNSLDKYENLDPWITSRCCKGKPNAPKIITTNPPFSGQKIESQITDRTILKHYDFGHKFIKNHDGHYDFSKKDEDILFSQAPELLFLERCLDWLKPGGRMGIVMPKGFLDNISYEPYRDWLISKYIINGIITLHKDTFQPDTGVRTCVLLITKPINSDYIPDDYEIFMAQSKRIGQDSKGNPVFTLDGNGKQTTDLDCDLDNIAETYYSFKNGHTIEQSEYVFTINKSDIKDRLNLNPQHYSPRLNIAIDNILKFDEKDNWSVTTVGQLESDIKIYIGPRWNSSNIKVESPDDTSKLTPYLTANGALELRRFSVKWFDISKASKKQKECIELLRVKEGDILITRSGTIGKVTYATKYLAEHYIISDDLVRIRVYDDNIRAYLLAYLTSNTALSLMLLDEYGSVQQHLQPRHIQQMLIPIPDDWKLAEGIISAGKELIEAMEKLSYADANLTYYGFDSIV